MTLANIGAWLVALGKGAVQAFGEATVPAVLTPNPNGKGAVVVLREGYRAEVLAGVDVHQRVHRFDDLGGLASWLLKHAEPETTEILFQASGKVSAGLEPSNRYADVVTAELKPHPRRSRWLALVGRELDQRTLHRHIVSSLEDFVPVKDQEGRLIGSSGEQLASAVAKLAVRSGGSVEIQLDDLGYTRFTAGTKDTQLTGRLPPSFTLRLPWFLGANPEDLYDVTVHLAVDPDEGLSFELEMPGLPVVEHQALLDAVAHLRGELGEPWLVGLGELRVVSVPKVG